MLDYAHLEELTEERFEAVVPVERLIREELMELKLLFDPVEFVGFIFGA